jgi:hypothetical protein
LGDGGEGLIAAIADRQIEVVAFQHLLEAKKNVRVVFDDEDFGFHFKRVSRAD